MKQWPSGAHRLAGFVLATTIASAAADPVAPPGWQATEESLATRYQPVGHPTVELRLLRAEPAMADLPDWFAQRLRGGVRGLSAVDWGPARPLGRQAWMATGQTLHGARRHVVAMGCQTPDGLLRFATLTLPTERAEAERHSRSAAAVLEPACLQAANTNVATIPAAAQTMKPSLATKANPVDPADALKESDIESVLYAWQQRYQHDGLKFMEWTYLLMKDGSARDDVPKQAPADFDLAADRRDQPRRWGRWQRSGTRVQVDFGDGWQTPPGQMLRLPGRPGERLAGVYEASTSYSQGDQVALWFNSGIELRADGSFKRWNHRGAGVSSGSGHHKSMSMSSSDDKGATTSIGGPGIAGGLRSSSGVTDDDLEGSYHIDGWSITLRHRSGQVQRSFFFAEPSRRTIGLAGAELDRRRPK